ncbi:Aste57867_16244 [Aphanomyces stellatus]|uniref:Aste57867_16244 protein n=1 Tax=Aphanomyces stellatus TaxID=120398 RepID=A0A485L5U0_9STRA|nr:hypothetical protein As57867_016187 [Aphanomyces stellatus]VFT93022.1 Aste57867_16244 [Aphanomyces stellatus]
MHDGYTPSLAPPMIPASAPLPPTSCELPSSGVLYFDLTQWNAFRPSYQRNNKKGGTKNLRCFPNCCNGVHATKGFCGSAVTARFQWLHVQDPIPLVHLVAQFSPMADIGQPRWATFSALPTSMDLGWYIGDCVSVDESEVVVSFNTVLKGWHYGWVSNRHASDTLHALCVYALVEAGSSGTVECIHRIHTPLFRIFSRRRAKDMLMRRGSANQLPRFVLAAPGRRRASSDQTSVKPERPRSDPPEDDLFTRLLEDDDDEVDNDETSHKNLINTSKA